MLKRKRKKIAQNIQFIVTSQIPSTNPHIAAIEQYEIKSFGTAVHCRIQINSAPCKTNVNASILLRPIIFDTPPAKQAAIALATPKDIIT